MGRTGENVLILTGPVEMVVANEHPDAQSRSHLGLSSITFCRHSTVATTISVPYHGPTRLASIELGQMDMCHERLYICFKSGYVLLSLIHPDLL